MRSLWLALVLCAALPALAEGKLLIIGGALKSSSADVYRAFIDAVPAGAQIGIVPVASGRPAKYAAMVQQDLQAYGVAADRIHILPLAEVDDPGTGFDESQWRDRGYDADWVASLKPVRAFWFVGGDQTRILRALRRDGQDSPLAQFMRRQLAGGGIVAGTSAGAAMMSEQMIAGGDSVSALLDEPATDYRDMSDQEAGPLIVQPGMGFLPTALVDQHFDRKARLGRLAAALCQTRSPWALGVDEDSAALVDLGQRRLTALGNGNLTLLKADQLQCHKAGPGYRTIEGLALWLLARGDSMALDFSRFSVAAGKSATVGREAFSAPVRQGGGMALANGRLDESLGFELLDNASARELTRASLVAASDGLHWLEYRFAQSPDSQGYWGYLDGTKDSYSLHNVAFSIHRQLLEVRR